MKKTIFSLIAIGILIGSFILMKDNSHWLSTSLIRQNESIITLQTNLGEIEIQLLPTDAPRLTENFRLLAKNGFYTDSIFHRVINGFMIQGGDFENHNGTGGHAYESEFLDDEFSPRLSHIRGAVSMANRGSHTNGSQFFIVQQDATFLDGKHSIFGHVINGMEVVDRIAQVKTDLNDAPLEKVTIKKVSLR
jgi:peptidyl-prolyl cis-trans isomerase B (cyclophilin B)